MRKREQEHKEQERPRRYYFFDYLFWLGEMARWHYKGEPRRPDGNAMLMLCIMIVVIEPMLALPYVISLQSAWLLSVAWE